MNEPAVQPCQPLHRQRGAVGVLFLAMSDLSPAASVFVAGASVVSSAGTRWQLQGDTTWFTNRAGRSNLVSGEHILEFQTVAGCVAPPAQTPAGGYIFSANAADITNDQANGDNPGVESPTSQNQGVAAGYLGGTGNAIVRAIDGEVADQINRANVTANTGANHVEGGVILISNGPIQPVLLPGYYQMELGPSAALVAAAGWLITQLTNTALTFALPSGLYTIPFRPIPDYVTPPNLTLQVVGGATAIMNDSYVMAAASFSSASLGGNPLQMVFAAGAGQSYTLDWSTNLINWTHLITNTIPASGLLNFTDTPNTNNSKSIFYRARLAP